MEDDVSAGSCERSTVGGRAESVVDNSGTTWWKREGSWLALVVLPRRLCEGVAATEAGVARPDCSSASGKSRSCTFLAAVQLDGHDGGSTMPSTVKVMSRQGIVLFRVLVCRGCDGGSIEGAARTGGPYLVVPCFVFSLLMFLVGGVL